MQIAILYTLTSLVAASVAFWRMECRGRLGVARIDPLMAPGKISKHAHVIHGGSGFSFMSSYDDLMASECTSCAVTQDKSVYWSPALYFQHGNGTYQLVNQVGGMLAYYQLDKDADSPDGRIVAFPKGFQMMAGDSNRRNYSISNDKPESYHTPDIEKSLWALMGQTNQQDLEQRAIGFNCLNYAVNPEGAFFRHVMPPKKFLDERCHEGVRMEIQFPSCWNGKDVDSPNHKDHVAYPDLVMDGRCPEGFKVKLPSLMYETIWDTYAFRGLLGQFVLANGDVSGFGYHADFIMGWDEDFLQQAVDTCTNMTGMIQDCPLFNIQNEYQQSRCTLENLPEVLKNEKVMGQIGQSLPGNVEIVYGPDRDIESIPMLSNQAISTSTLSAVSALGETMSLAAATASPPASLSPLSLSIFLPVPETLSTPSTSSSPDLAVTPLLPTTASPEPVVPSSMSLERVRTDYFTNGNVVSEIIWEQAIMYVTEYATTVTTTVWADGPSPTLNMRRASSPLYAHRHGGIFGRHGGPVEPM